MKRALGRGLCAAAFLGLALLAAAPDAAAHTGGSALHNLTHPHHLNNPRIITSPASGDTYLPGETITVYVPWGRTASGTCIQIHSVGTVELEMTVGGVTRTLTGRYENRRNRYGSGFDGTWLYFDYVVQKGDRDTDGVSLAEDALSSPGTSGSSIRGVACGSFSTFELSTNLHGFANQSGHKVDTPAPTFSGVTAPAVLFIRGRVGELPAAAGGERGRRAQRQLFGDVGAAAADGLYAERVHGDSRGRMAARWRGRTTRCGRRTASTARPT